MPGTTSHLPFGSREPKTWPLGTTLLAAFALVCLLLAIMFGHGNYQAKEQIQKLQTENAELKGENDQLKGQRHFSDAQFERVRDHWKTESEANSNTMKKLVDVTLENRKLKEELKGLQDVRQAVFTLEAVKLYVEKLAEKYPKDDTIISLKALFPKPEKK